MRSLPQKFRRTQAGSPLAWRRDGNGWLLLAGRRRFGRVVPDPKYPGMWRSVKAGGQLSDMSNLSWAKNVKTVRPVLNPTPSGEVRHDRTRHDQK